MPLDLHGAAGTGARAPSGVRGTTSSTAGEVAPTEGICKPLADVLMEFRRRVPDSLVKTPVDRSGFSLKYIPWHIVNKIPEGHKMTNGNEGQEQQRQNGPHAWWLGKTEEASFPLYIFKVNTSVDNIDHLVAMRGMNMPL